MDAAYLDGAQFPYVRQTAQTADELLAKFDLLRQKAARCMRNVGNFPGAIATVPCMQNANLSNHNKSPVLAST